MIQQTNTRKGPSIPGVLPFNGTGPPKEVRGMQRAKAPTCFACGAILMGPRKDESGFPVYFCPTCEAAPEVSRKEGAGEVLKEAA